MFKRAALILPPGGAIDLIVRGHLNPPGQYYAKNISS